MITAMLTICTYIGAIVAFAGSIIVCCLMCKLAAECVLLLNRRLLEKVINIAPTWSDWLHIKPTWVEFIQSTPVNWQEWSPKTQKAFNRCRKHFGLEPIPATAEEAE